MRRLMLAALLAASCSGPDDVTRWGQPRVIDGDTIVLYDERIRFAAIDTPELDTIDGLLAKSALLSAIATEDVRCIRQGTDRYRRTLATCHTRSGINLSVWMIENGYARRWR